MKNYIPQPIDTSSIKLSDEITILIEFLAKNVHEVWAAERISQGWRWGAVRDDLQKLHPCLISYEELSESERAYDRHTAMETLKVIQKLGFKIIKTDTL